MTRRRDGLSITAVQIWRYLRDEGGFHRSAEVADAIKIEGGPQKANTAAAKALWCLEARGHVQRHPGHVDPRRPHYGVTTRCVAPEFETLTPSPTHKPAQALDMEAS